MIKKILALPVQILLSVVIIITSGFYWISCLIKGIVCNVHGWLGILQNRINWWKDD